MLGRLGPIRRAEQELEAELSGRGKDYFCVSWLRRREDMKVNGVTPSQGSAWAKASGRKGSQTEAEGLSWHAWMLW